MSQVIEELQAEDRVLEIAKLFPRQGQWTEDDYFKLPETNGIVELSKGRLIITPAPTTEHQIILGNLYFVAKGYIMSKNLGTILMSPIDVRLWTGNIRQPDIVFISDEHRDRITKQYCSVPDLVIEITSSGTENQDRIDKFYEYQKAGVSEYWIVDPYKQAIEILTLENGTYVLFGNWGIGEVAKSKLLTGFEVNIDELMEGD